MIELKDRIILDTGISVIDDAKMAQMIFEGTDIPDHYRVLDSFDAQAYKLLYQEDLRLGDDEADFVFSEEIQTEDHVDRMISILTESPRFDIKNENRLKNELEFFVDEQLAPFVLKLSSLVEKFKENNHVWGVGRGSSCASYVLYLIYIHDVDPTLYDIPFKEFSKQD